MTLDAPLPVLQISFYKSLERLRPTHLLEALLATSADADIHAVDRELREYADTAALRRYGVYQIGDDQARSWMVAGKSWRGAVPARRASQDDQRQVGFSRTRA